MNHHDHSGDFSTAAHAGHAWQDAPQVRKYIDSAVERDRHRAPQLELLVRLLPFEPSDAFRFLDLGGGHGNLSRLVLDHYPNSSAVLFDASASMLEAATANLGAYAGRVSFVQGSFADHLPSAAFGAVVSSLAIHHLASPEDEARLYRSAFDALAPGGCFLNLDLVAPPTRALEPVYRGADDPWLKPFFTAPRDDIRPVEMHLSALRQAGFLDTDCFWKSLHEALYGGFKGSTFLSVE